MCHLTVFNHIQSSYSAFSSSSSSGYGYELRDLDFSVAASSTDLSQNRNLTGTAAREYSPPPGLHIYSHTHSASARENLEGQGQEDGDNTEEEVPGNIKNLGKDFCFKTWEILKTTIMGGWNLCFYEVTPDKIKSGWTVCNARHGNALEHSELANINPDSDACYHSSHDEAGSVTPSAISGEHQTGRPIEDASAANTLNRSRRFSFKVWEALLLAVKCGGLIVIGMNKPSNWKCILGRAVGTSVSAGLAYWSTYLQKKKQNEQKKFQTGYNGTKVYRFWILFTFETLASLLISFKDEYTKSLKDAMKTAKIAKFHRFEITIKMIYILLYPMMKANHRTTTQAPEPAPTAPTAPTTEIPQTWREKVSAFFCKPSVWVTLVNLIPQGSYLILCAVHQTHPIVNIARMVLLGLNPIISVLLKLIFPHNGLDNLSLLLLNGIGRLIVNNTEEAAEVKYLGKVDIEDLVIEFSLALCTASLL